MNNLFFLFAKLGKKPYTSKGLRNKLSEIRGQNLHLVSFDLTIKDIIVIGFEHQWLHQDKNLIYFKP